MDLRINEDQCLRILSLFKKGTLNKMAKKVGFIKRERNLSAYDFF